MVKYILLSITMLLSSCLKDDLLISKREDNFSNSLKIDGYYKQENSKNKNIYFLYKNGIMVYGDSPTNELIPKYEEDYRNGIFYNRIQNVKYHWGVYKIENQKISIERWYPGDKPYDAFLETGEILNDSTFRITTFSEPDGSEPETRNEIYRFKKFSGKPDSTNVFIK